MTDITEMKNIEGELCTICGDNIVIEEGYTKLTCSHIFHCKCMLEMVMKTVQYEKCPNCREHFGTGKALVEVNQTVLKELETRNELNQNKIKELNARIDFLSQKIIEERKIYNEIFVNQKQVIGNEQLKNFSLFTSKFKEIRILQNMCNNLSIDNKHLTNQNQYLNSCNIQMKDNEIKRIFYKHSLNSNLPRNTQYFPR